MRDIAERGAASEKVFSMVKNIRMKKRTAGARVRWCATYLAALLLTALLGPAGLWAQYAERESDRPRLAPEDYTPPEERRSPVSVEHYEIEAELLPATHELKAQARVRFQALEEVSSVEFELNNNLFPTQITGEDGQALSVHRVSDDLTLSVSLGKTLPQGQSTTIRFEYAGRFADAAHSPLEGVQLAYIGEQGSYLLYPARWFPLSGYGTNRYTAELHLTVPSGYQVVSGGTAQSAATTAGNVRFSFRFDRPQFPGSLVVVKQEPAVVQAEGLTMKVYFSPAHQAMAQAYGEAAARMVNFFTAKFGPPPLANLSLVEIDDQSLGGYAGPEMIFLASRAINDPVNIRLLAQEVAQQWWRGLVSPATRSDLWLDHGLATYSEALYLEDAGGAAALQERLREMSIDALTHDTVPIRAAGRLHDFSPAYKTILYDKSGVVLHMLRWVIGDDAFFQALKQFADHFAFRAATTEDFRKEVDQTNAQNLQPFFLQWMESTGASDFKAEYVV